MAGPTYTYTPDVPQGPSGMDSTQPIILQNFQAIDELINVDHIGFNTPSDSGKHNQLSLQFQSTLPTSTTTGINLFCQTTPDGPNLSELFIQYPTGAISSIVQISNPIAPASGPGTSGNGYTKFSSGLCIYYSTVFFSSGYAYGNFISGSPSSNCVCVGFVSPISANVQFIGSGTGPAGANYTQFILQSVGGSLTYNYFIISGYLT